MYRIYQVQKDDTLDRIAEMTGVTPRLIRELNGFNDEYKVIEGERIIVPNDNTMFSRYQIKKGDSLFSVAQIHDISANELALLNGIKMSDFIYPGDYILVPREDVEFYITKENESLRTVANHFGVMPEEVVSQNQTIYLQPDQLILYKKEKKF